MECIKFEFDKKHMKNFIQLSHKLYDQKCNMQNDSELKALLLGTHALSKYFKLHKFCIYQGKDIVGRFVITIYPNDDIAYLGFFECINDEKVSKFLLKKAECFVKAEGYRKIVGPVDASFWIKYRLKTNLFHESPYTGEPYNLDYYYRLFIESGYEVAQHYTSSAYKVVKDDYYNEKCEKRYAQFIEKGYIIKSPVAKEWDSVIEDLYRLITDLYKDFPIYKGINREDFSKYFESYKTIIRFDMVKMAYYKGQAVGFYISIPNYQNRVYHTNNPLNILKILWRRRKPEEYVMLYMGVQPAHRGLGNAIVKSVLEQLKVSQLPSIGALMRDGKATRGYAKDLTVKQYEYVLLEKNIEGETP